MAWDKGFNFRGSSGYVTDGINETYVIGTDTYPTTRNGVTFGVEDTFTFYLDRNSGNDRRLAGLIGDGSFPKRFRIDLPIQGAYDIYLAIGDASSIQTTTWQTADGVTVLDTYDVIPASNQFFDATGVQLTAANWPTNNQSVRRVFNTQIFRLQTHANSTTSACAHVRLVQVFTPTLMPQICL